MQRRCDGDVASVWRCAAAARCVALRRRRGWFSFPLRVAVRDVAGLRARGLRGLRFAYGLLVFFSAAAATRLVFFSVARSCS
jgi:hypothetical protein